MVSYRLIIFICLSFSALARTISALEAYDDEFISLTHSCPAITGEESIEVRFSHTACRRNLKKKDEDYGFQ